MSEQLTDQVLVERVQKGDQKAFNLLVVRYQHKLASLVSRYVPSGDVPDVVQEAFIKAYRALDSFRGDSAFYTWLYRIAVNSEIARCSGASSTSDVMPLPKLKLRKRRKRLVKMNLRT
ncbi:hypothetical protein DJICPGNB_12340 [Escherichia coli]|nr:hypothetical protein DJICPGNB_12340 [Escherichia coli]